MISKVSGRASRPLTALLFFAFTHLAALEAQARPMRFEQLSIEQGLSQSIVNCVLQDRVGFLWLGTQEGLNRYDGYGFKIYRHDANDPASLPNDFIVALAEDPAGDLWIGTEGGGLARWRRSTDSFESYQHDPSDPGSLSGDRVLDLAWDQTGSVLWLGTPDSGLSRFDPATGSFQQFRHDPSDPGSLAHDQLDTVYVDRSGHLWVGTRGGLDLFDVERGTFIHFQHDPADPRSLSDNRVHAILGDRRGVLWVGTEGGLNRLDPRTGVFERYVHNSADPGSLSHDWVRALVEDRDGRLWVGTDSGLNLWQASGGFTKYHPHPGEPNSLGGAQVLALFQDRGDHLWISTLGAGVSKWNPRTWTFFHHQSQDADGAGRVVLAISEDPRGNLWTGTFGGGLERIGGGLKRIGGGPLQRVVAAPAGGPRRVPDRHIRFRHDSRDPRSLSDDRVTALLHDRRGTLWVGTLAGGLNRLDKSDTFERYPHDPRDPQSLSSNTVTTLFEDRDGRLWIGTHDGLNLHLGAGGFTHFRHDPDDPTSLGNDRVVALAQDPDGGLWLATDGGGLNYFRPGSPPTSSATFLRLEHDPARGPANGGLSSNELNALHVDNSGRLWIGTEGSGLNKLEHFDEATGEALFRNFSRGEGLPDETIWGIRSDLGGALWLSTNHGLARFDSRTETFTSYSTSHGLQSDKFMMGAHFASPSGELFFGGVNGLNAFFPDRIEGNATVPPVILTGLQKFNEPMSMGRPLTDIDEVELSYRDRFLTFEFAALDYAAPEENRYRYRLAGLDEAWVEMGTERRVTFASLEPGSYTLRVQGSNNDGVWNEAGASLEVFVASPPWRTWWAYTIYSLALVSMAFGLVRQHQLKLGRERQAAAHDRAAMERERAMNRRLREGDKLKDEFLANTSHELRAPLYGITGLTESLIDGARGDLSEPVKSDLSMIMDSGRRLANMVDAMLDFSKLRHGSLEIDQRPVDLRCLVEVVLTLSRPLVFSSRLELRNTVPADLPSAHADENHLQQILYDLVGNAIKFTECGLIEVSAERRDQQLVVRVSDTGVGIPLAKQEQIFDAFGQVDGSAERQHQGTGLGLAITRELVELHGGSIWVESVPAEGASFFFTLPVTTTRADADSSAAFRVSRVRRPLPEPPPTPIARQPASPEESRSGSESVRILIVDDDPVIREVLVHQLADRSLDLFQAASGAEALEILEKESPDLVLLDIMMPKMSGYDVCRRIRLKYSAEDLPILFLTAKEQLSDLVNGFTAGGNDYLVKPVIKAELLARVNFHLKILRAHRNLGRRVEEKLLQINVLRDLLPICASCEKIRDDQEYRSQLETYIESHSEAPFSHGICPDCSQKPQESRINNVMGDRSVIETVR